MVQALRDGRVVNVFLSQNYKDLENLVAYTDPFDLKNSLISFDYELNGQDAGSFEITMELINPGQVFEKSYLKYYSLIFEEGRITNKAGGEIEGNDLLYYIRWGYGVKETDGLSRIIPAYLTSINHSFNAPGEKKVTLTFVDALTNGKKNLQTAENLGTVQTTIINCLDGKNRLRPISDIVSEVLAEMANGFETVYPFVDLVHSSEIANLLNRVQTNIAKQLAGENISEDDLINAIKDSGIQLNSQYLSREFVNGLGEIPIVNDLIPPLWGSFEKTKSPSKIHHLLAYKLLFEDLGINFSYGIKVKETEVPQVTLETISNILSDLPGFVTALASRIVKKPIESLDMPVTGDIYKVDYDTSGKRNDYKVGSVSDGIIESTHNIAVDERMLLFGQLFFRPSFQPPTYEDGKQFSENTHPNGVDSFKKAYYLNIDKTYYIEISISNRTKIANIVNAMTVELHSTNQEATSADPSLNRFLGSDTPRVVEEVDSIFVEVSFSKATFEQAKSTITSLIEDLNALIGVYDGVEDHLLGMFTVPFGSLMSKEKENVRQTIPVPITEESTILFIAPRTQMRELIGAAKPNESFHAIHSFKDLSSQDTLNLEFGYEGNRNIITQIELNQDLMFAKARVAIENKNLVSIYELFNDNGVAKTFAQATKLFLEQVYIVPSRSVSQPAEFVNTAGKLLEESETENYAELINYINTFYSDVRTGKYGEEVKTILDSDYAQKYISVINSPVFQDLFVDTQLYETIGYAAINGALVSKKSNTITYYSIRQDRLNDFIKGKFNFYNARLASFLHKYPFSTQISVVGIPELSNFVFDVSHRTVQLKVLDIRTKQSHWISGIYKILGYTHTISSSGYNTVLNLIRMPHYNTKTLL